MSSKHKARVIRFGGTSVLTLAVLAALHSARAVSADAAAGDEAAANNEAGDLEEIVVTAEKRSEDIQHVAGSVSAFTDKDLALKGIASVQDLTDYTPGLSYSAYDNRPYIRGIGRNTDNLAVDTGVAQYVDGIYNGANGSTILQGQLDDLFINNVQVLRGPQSTLFGRNSDGGSINYISQRPTPDFQAEVRTGYDSFEKSFYEAVASGPISDSIRFRIGGNYTRQNDGYYKNLVANGLPEGGDVAQGGNGWAYHVEGQLEGNIGSKFDWWTKLSSSDYDTSYHTETLLGPQDQREFANVLWPNANFGLCALPGGAAAGLGCAGPQSPDTIVPGSVISGNPAVIGNPANYGHGDFESGFKSTSKENNNWAFATVLTYHLPDFDIKYLGGYQSFNYALTAPWNNGQGTSSGVYVYQLQGPAAATGLCLLNFANAGCTQNLQINSAQNWFTFDEFERFYSNELDFASTGNGPLQWLGGLYQYHEGYQQPINLASPDQAQFATPDLIAPLFVGKVVAAAPNPTRNSYSEFTQLTEDSYGIFGQSDWQMNDQFKFTAGLRGNYDRKDGWEHFRLVVFNGETLVPGVPLGVNQFGADAPAFDVTTCTTGTYRGAGPCTINPTLGYAQRTLGASWEALTGTAKVAWTPTPDTLAYLSYSRGYKAGAFNSGILAVNPETGEETNDAFEVGVNETVGHSFRAHWDAYYMLWRGDQQPLGQLDAATGVINTIIVNIPVSHLYGLELENTWNPITDLNFTVNYDYARAVIADMKGQCYQDAADPDALAPGANTNGCAAAGLQNLVGQSLPEVPRNKVTFNTLYTLRFDPGSFALSGTFVWKDKTYDSVFNRYYNLAPSYSQVNLRGTWTDTGNHYSVILYCDNVFNTIGYDATGGLAVTAPGPGQVIDSLASFTPPRVYGIQLQYRIK
jgi:iron complex outermembrane receptor protein